MIYKPQEPDMSMSLTGRKPSWNKRGPRRYLTFDHGTEAIIVGLSENQYQWLKERWTFPVEEGEDEGDA